jgi:hypothetical protein
LDGSIGNEQLISAWMISDRATATDRELLDALLDKGLDLQLQPLAPLQNAPMARTNPLRRESTAVMAANIGRELKEIRAALANSRGDLVAEPRITAAALAHLLLCSRELLQNLLIDTARRPRRIQR